MSVKTKKRISKKAKKAAPTKAASTKTAKKAPATTKFGAGKRGARYGAEQKAQVVQFVNDHNAKYGRGGQSKAAAKFGLSVLTVASWLRSPMNGGASKGVAVKAAKVGKVKGAAKSTGVSANVVSLIEVSDQLRKLEDEAAKLRAKYDSLRAAIQSAL